MEFNTVNMTADAIEELRRWIQCGIVTPDPAWLDVMVKPEARSLFESGESIMFQTVVIVNNVDQAALVEATG